MDWATVIERNREALLGVVATLFVLAGLGTSGPARLPRHLVSYVLRILRPAETATRRLIVIAAHTISPIHPPFGAFLHGLDPNKARGRRPCSGGGADDGGTARVPAFALADPVKRFSCEPRRRRARSFPRISVLGVSDPAPLPPVPTPEDPVAAGALCGRLKALKRALDDIDGQARRLVRWQARRERAFSSPARLSPLRNGRPPGGRTRPRHEVDVLLADLHWLAMHALLPPDTS